MTKPSRLTREQWRQYIAQVSGDIDRIVCSALGEDDILAQAFHQGQAAADRDAYRCDCPHAPGTERYEAWIAGFEHEDGDTRWSVSQRK